MLHNESISVTEYAHKLQMNMARQILSRILELQDAAEFEARVASKLAGLFSASTKIAYVCQGCPCEDDCYSGYFKCKEAILKHARLQVEEEMENAD